jgi:hypothetical protein
MVQVAQFSQAVSDLSEGCRAINKGADVLATARELKPALDRLDTAVHPSLIHLRATVVGEARPQGLTVDLTRFGLRSDMPLYDDGAHDDGAANDGVWACEVHVRPNRLKPMRDEWRRTPGILGLSVSAHWSETVSTGAVAPLLVWSVVERQTLADRINKPEERIEVEGADFSIDFIDKHDHDPEVKLVAKGGPWKMTMRFNYTYGRTIDMGPFSTFGFDWRGTLPTFGLSDRPLFDEPRESNRITITGAQTRKAVAEGWLPVRVPINDLVGEDTGFSRNHLHSMVFSGEAKPGEVLWFRSPCLIPEGEP